MRGNLLGNLFSVVTFGESHGPAIGVVLDGVPAGLAFNLNDLRKELKRRAPGQVDGTTSRKESDEPEVLSGIFNNVTLGSPIAIIIKNTNQKSEDYNESDDYRPGHADKTTILKYGIRDYRGGGRSSGRETASRVIAGYFASLIIPQVKVCALNLQIGSFKFRGKPDVSQDHAPYYFPDPAKNEEIKNYLLDLKSKGDSVGGRVGIFIKDCPQGLGEPVFDKLKADLSKALMSIGAACSISFGLGEDFADSLGSQVTTNLENFGGIEGGISNGDPIYIEMTFRPPSTVGEKAKAGRHDPCILPRVIPVVEAMVKVVLADHYLRQKAYEK